MVHLRVRWAPVLAAQTFPWLVLLSGIHERTREADRLRWSRRLTLVFRK